MTDDDLYYRRCSVPGCRHKELRGAWVGAFVDGKFVCDEHAKAHKKLLQLGSPSGIDGLARNKKERQLMAVKGPVEMFKDNVRKLTVGASHVYHIGNLQEDRQTSPSLNNIAIMAYGLNLIGAVTLKATAIWKGEEPKRQKVWTEYALRVLRPINPIDFDRARKAWLESLKEEN